MATIILTVWPFTNVTNYQGLGESLAQYNDASLWTLVGGATYDTCLTNADGLDDKYCTITPFPIQGNCTIDFFIQNLGLDSSVIPNGSTINSVQFQTRIKNTDTLSLHVITAADYGLTYNLGAYGNFVQNTGAFDLVTAPPDPIAASPFTTYVSAVLTTNPNTGSAWVMADLFANQPNQADSTLLGGYFEFVSVLADVATKTVSISEFYLNVDFTSPGGTNTWNLSTTFAAPAGFLPAGAGHSATIAVPINVQGGIDVENQPSSGGIPGQPLPGVGNPSPNPGLPQNPRQGVPPVVGNRQANGSAGYNPVGGLNLPDDNQFRLERFDAKYRPEEHIG